MICIDAAKESYNQSFIDQTSVISDQTLASPSADTTYRVSVYGTQNFGINSSAADIQFGLVWDDEFYSSALMYIPLGRFQGSTPAQNSAIVNVKAGGSLTLHVIVASAMNAGDKYSLYVVVEEL